MQSIVIGKERIFYIIFYTHKSETRLFYALATHVLRRCIGYSKLPNAASSSSPPLSLSLPPCVARQAGHCAMVAIAAEVEAAMERIKVLKAPPLVKWGQALEVLSGAALAYETVLHSDMVLCHPDNRGGLGLNARNAHMVAVKIKQRGGDWAELAKATAFELASDDTDLHYSAIRTILNGSIY